MLRFTSAHCLQYITVRMTYSDSSPSRHHHSGETVFCKRTSLETWERDWGPAKGDVYLVSETEHMPLFNFRNTLMISKGGRNVGNRIFSPEPTIC